jgi:uncharacterized cupin superfamily protein
MKTKTILKGYPVTIDNGHGEWLTFLGREIRDGIEYIQVENLVSPGSGPPMHVHHQQIEQLHILEGKMGVEVMGEPSYFLNAGQSATFEAGVAHRFWNAGSTTLKCTGEIWPPNNIEYFLGEIFRSARENGGGRPASYDAAYLLSKYRSEFEMFGIPAFVKKVIFPILIFAGKLRGQERKFKDAPAAV